MSWFMIGGISVLWVGDWGGGRICELRPILTMVYFRCLLVWVVRLC